MCLVSVYRCIIGYRIELVIQVKSSTSGVYVLLALSVCVSLALGWADPTSLVGLGLGICSG